MAVVPRVARLAGSAYMEVLQMGRKPGRTPSAVKQPSVVHDEEGLH